MKAANPNNQRIRELIAEFGLTRQKVADHCGVSKSAVDRWLEPAGSANIRYTPDRAVRLLEFSLGLVKAKKQRQPQVQA
jgi:transcriptional regulator with XRE-family HTH domain